MSTYSQLKKVIPADQALANKAIEAAFQQIKTIFNSTPAVLSPVVETLETNVGLDLINNLTQPIPQDVLDYFTENFATGTGPDGLLLLTDVIGSPTGWIYNEALSNTTSILTQMTTDGEFDELTDPTDGVYTIMQNTLDGDYTVVVPDPPPTPPDPQTFTYTITIPGGLPGAGTYGPYSSLGAALTDAFTTGLNPAMVSAVGNIVANNTSLVNQTTSNFNDICNQLQRENTNLALAGVVFADLTGNVQPTTLATGLPQYGLDTNEGGAAFVMESLANVNSIGGQAIISTMRQARNFEKLSSAGIETDILVSDVLPEPQAQLEVSQYTLDQAVAQKIT